jgi:hypothetical protein
MNLVALAMSAMGAVVGDGCVVEVEEMRAI